MTVEHKKIHRRDMLPLRLALTAFGLFLAYLAIAATAWNLGEPQHELLQLTGLPDDPDIVLGKAVQDFRRSGQPPVSRDLAEMRRIARLDPLQFEPFLLSAIVQLNAGNERLSGALLEKARMRNPRSRETRILLLDHYTKAKNGAAAVREINSLYWLMPDARQLLIDLLVSLAIRPETRKSAIKEIQRSPLRSAMLEQLARLGVSPFMLLDITRDLRGIAKRPEDARWVGSVIERMAARGDLKGAKRLWRHFNAIDAEAENQTIFDGDLRGLAGPPFGWKIESGAAGIADLKDGALSIQHFGRDNIVFARQLMTLAPGRYQLTFTASHGQKEKANLAWRIDCMPSGATLLELPINPQGLFDEVQDNAFTVPPSECPGQWIALTGRPLEFPETRSFTLTKVRIEPVSTP